MPAKRFFVMYTQITRVQAKNDLRQLQLLNCGSKEAMQSVIDRLSSELGDEYNMKVAEHIEGDANVSQRLNKALGL